MLQNVKLLVVVFKIYVFILKCILNIFVKMCLININSVTLQKLMLLKNFKQIINLAVKSKLANQIFSHETSNNSTKRYYGDYYRHKYDAEVEKLINEQITTELAAGYSYLNLACHFGRPDIALPGVQGFFMKMFYEELEHGLGFIKYQNMRGGQITLEPLQCQKPKGLEILDAFELSLEMEKSVKEVHFNEISIFD